MYSQIKEAKQFNKRCERCRESLGEWLDLKACADLFSSPWNKLSSQSLKLTWPDPHRLQSHAVAAASLGLPGATPEGSVCSCKVRASAQR